MLVDPSAAIVGLEGSSDQAFSANSQFLYVRNALQGTIHVFQVDQVTGALTQLQVVGGLPPGSAIGIAAR